MNLKLKKTELTEEELEQLLKNRLPGIEVHKAFSPMRNFAINKIEAREAAVAIHLRIIGEEVQIILIKRTKYEGAHSQQIAFPGGKKDKTDPDLQFTARRESQEELSIGTEQGICLGALTPIMIPASSFRVTPFVFVHKVFPSLKKEEREVQEIISCRMSDIDTFSKKTYQNVIAKPGLTIKNVPGVAYKRHFIWGATALILHELNCLLKISESKKRNKP
ncbi:MAG: CoA pyrophosphatase [Crocinitomicaceae bacterium]